MGLADPMLLMRRTTQAAAPVVRRTFGSAPVAVKEYPAKTPLHSFQVNELGAKMASFAGYEMPLLFKGQTLIESHNHTRTSASLFDVSHMGQFHIRGENAVDFLESFLPSDIGSMKRCQSKLSAILLDDGGILDDCIITRNLDDTWTMVVNGANKELVWSYIMPFDLNLDVEYTLRDDVSLLALQGPRAAEVLAKHATGKTDIATQRFMTSRRYEIGGMEVVAGRQGYTGEDGYEIQCLNDDATKLTKLLLADEAVKPAGLGARDSLRMEAGLCLHGQDIKQTSSLAEAGLEFIITKQPPETWRFAGKCAVAQNLTLTPPPHKLCGLFVDGAPAREGAQLYSKGKCVGKVTSGGFSPSLKRPIAMGMVKTSLTAPGTALEVEVRGKMSKAQITNMPFVPHKYYRKPKPTA